MRKIGKFVNLTLLLALNVLAADSVVAQRQPTDQGKEITFRISEPLKFKGRVVTDSLRKSEIAELLELPVRNGNSDLKDGYGVEMTRLNYERFKVYTCRQW